MNTSAEGQDFLRRAAVWAPKASQAGLRWPSVLEWGPGGALAEDLLGFRLEQVARQLQAKIAAAQRQAQLQEVTRTIERLREELRSFGRLRGNVRL